MDLTFLALSTAMFVAGVVYSVLMLRRGGDSTPGWGNLIIIGIGFLFQCGFLSERGQLHGRCPIMNGAEVLVFVAWSLAIMYFVLGRAFRLSLVGAFTAPILATLSLGALALSLMIPAQAKVADAIDPWLEMHAAMSLLAYGAFGFAAIAAIMYLVQNHLLKSGKPGSLAFKLPPIRYLTDALVRLLAIGLLLLTVGVVSALFREKMPDVYHLIIFGMVWIAYAVLLVYFFWRRPSVRWLALGALIAFALALITLTAIQN